MTDAPATPTKVEVPEPRAETPMIFPAINRIAADIGRFQKTGRGPTTQGAYPFLPVDDIVARLSDLFTEHGVIVVPRQVDLEQQNWRFPKVNLDGEPKPDGRPDVIQVQTRVAYEFDFIASVDGSLLTARAYGESIDAGDKGVRRAATAAYKEVVLRLFTIVAGDDDPDLIDGTDVEARVIRNDRGAQARGKAQAGKAERAPRAPRAPRGGGSTTPDAPAEGEAPPQAAPAAPQDDAPVSQDAPPVSQPEPEAEQQEAPAEQQEAPAEQPAAARPARAQRAPRPAAARTREEKPVAEQRADDWKVDPEDVAHAEATAPAAPAAAPAPREAAAPVAKPEATTADEQHFESVSDLRGAIRDALEARGLPLNMANDLGDEITQKARGAWFANMTDLRTVLKAVEAGQVSKAYEAENAGGF